MKRILLAIGHEQLEVYLKKVVTNFSFIGEISYREGVLNSCINLQPDILVLRETLPGSINILELIYSLRNSCFNTRIIFLSKERSIGDALLSELVSLGIYDIVTSNPVVVSDLISLINNPKNYSDVSFYRQKLVIDEKSNESTFVTPKQIVKTVYVNTNNNSDIQNNESDTTLAMNLNDDSNTKLIGNDKEEEEKRDVQKKGKTKKVESLLKQNDNKNKKVEEYKVDINSNNIPDDNKFIYDKTQYNSNVKNFNKAKSFVFIGAHAGVGSTQISFNFAIQLAKTYKTLYVDLSNTPYSICNIMLIENNSDISAYKNFSILKQSLITKESLLKSIDTKNDVNKNYKLLPSNLSMLFLPLIYEEDNMDFNYNKEFLFNLALKLDFDCIVFDFGNCIVDKIQSFIDTASSLIIVSTQDFNYLANINKIKIAIESNVSIDNVGLVINKFENYKEITSKRITEYTGCKVLTCIPYSKEFTYCNYIGTPILIKSKDREILGSFKTLEKSLLFK